MNDTSPEIESLFNTMIMKNSGQERLKMGFSMFDMGSWKGVNSLLLTKCVENGALRMGHIPHRIRNEKSRVRVKLGKR